MNFDRGWRLGARPVGVVTALVIGLTLAGCSSSGKAISPPAAQSSAANQSSSSPSAPAASSASSAASSAAGVDFSGKTITLVAPFSAGGSADTLARLVGQELGAFLPGHPTVVVKNMTGGGGSVGLDYVANKAAGDGTTIGFFGGGMAIRYVTKVTGFSSLADQPLIGGFPQGVVMPTLAKYGTDLSKLQNLSSPLKVAESSAGGTGAMMASIGSELLKIPMKQIFGFSGGGSDALTSMLRGETDAGATADTSYDKTYLPYVKKGQFEGFFQTGVMDDNGQIIRSALVPDVPTILDLYKQANNGADPTGDAWTAYQILDNLNTADYVMAVRKGTPDNVLSTLRQGFDKMSASQEWKTFTTSKLTAPLATVKASTATKSWSAFLDITDAQIALFKKYAGIKG